jgi:uncharacterized membrane protein
MDRIVDRLTARAASWFITIAVAFFPAFVAGGDSWLSLNLFKVAAAVNDKGHFRELYFAGMVISVFSLSNLWDNIGIRRDTPDRAKIAWRPLTNLIYGFFVIILFYGIWEFIRIDETYLSPEELVRDVWILIVVLIVSFFTEMMIAESEAVPHAWAVRRGPQADDQLRNTD